MPYLSPICPISHYLTSSMQDLSQGAIITFGLTLDRKVQFIELSFNVIPRLIGNKLSLFPLFE